MFLENLLLSIFIHKSKFNLQIHPIHFPNKKIELSFER